MNGLLGNEAVRIRIAGLIAEDRFPQASLFYGPNGVGKKLMALEVSRRLLCLSPAGAEACGTCPSCTVFSAGNHPDFILLKPKPGKKRSRAEDDEEGDPSGDTDNDEEKAAAGPPPIRPSGSISKERLKKMRELISHPPMVSARQVVVMDDADLMVDAQQNTLLKGIEEPRPGKHFIFVTSRLHKILATVRSRCAKFAFRALSRDETERVVKSLAADRNIIPGTLNFYLDCFPGSPLYVLAALDLPLEAGQWETIAAPNRPFFEAVSLAKELSGADTDSALVIAVVRAIAARRLKASSGADAGAEELWEKASRAETRLGMHIQKAFVFENLFL